MKATQHHILMALLIGVLLFCSTPNLQAAANEIVYSRGDSAFVIGTGSAKAETYDVAMHLTDRALVGLKVKALRIVFPSSNDLSDAKAWLSLQLPSIKSQRMQEPDIAVQPFEASKGYTQVDFATPYTITEDGLYVGYSFKVAKGNSPQRPLVVTGHISQGGLFLHTSDIYRTAWHDLADTYTDAALQVVLEGEGIREHAVGVSYVEEYKGRTGQPTSTIIEIINHGTQGVASLDYTYEIAGLSGSVHQDLGSKRLPGIFGRSTTFEVQLPAVAEKGAYPVVVTITSVDGFQNEDLSPQGQGLANLYHTLPVHRAVLEEYTGTWCGYCPRGFVGLEEMNRLHPDDFIGISYHNKDPMEVMSSAQYPSNISGFPSAFLDRQLSTDAFSGNAGGKTFGIEDLWSRACNVVAPAEVEVSSVWTEDSILTATARITFPLDRDDCPYEVGFILLSDGLTGTSSNWKQANYYSGETGWPSSMDLFTKGGNYVSGLTYNFVYLARSSMSGIENSLQSPIVADVAQTCDYSFDLREIRNTSGQPVVQDKNNLRVVALLFDKPTGVILNANKAAAGTSSVTSIGQPTGATDQRVCSTQWYDLHGHRIVSPRHGLYIKTEILGDGSIRSSKVYQ
ncbi:MAG: hypothetical protein ACSW8D_02155 [Prevotella sp.]|jgi:hypothetical protein